MPGPLPPVPVETWDQHQNDTFDALTKSYEDRIGAVAATEQEIQAEPARINQVAEQDWQAQSEQMTARVAGLAQAEAAPEQDWQEQHAAMQARVAQFAQAEQSPSQYPGDTGSAPPSPGAPAGELQDYARQAAVKAGIDPETFVRQIQQESGFNPSARNPSGATGIAQIVPSAHPGVDPNDPRASLDYAANWMGQLTKQYGGDKAKALAAYNAGPGNVEKYGGVPPFEETQRYIRTILGPENGGDALGAVSPAPSGRNADIAPIRATERGSRVEAVGQFEQGLAAEDAYSICGPVAALAFAQANGRNPDLGEARRLAKQVGWTSQGGMNGVQNEAKLLEQMGVASRLDTNPDFGKIAQDAEAGNPVIISTPVHYYFINGYSKDTGQLHVGKTGEARKGGGSWMSAQQIATLDGGINGALFVDNPQSPTPSVAAEEDTSQLGPLGGSQAGLGAFDATRLTPAAGLETPSAQDARTRGNAGLPGGEMRPEYERISRGRPEPMDVLAAVDVPNRIAFTAADAALRGDNLGDALFQSGVTGGRQAKGADILADVGVTDPTVLAQAGKVIDAAVDYTNAIPGVTFAKKAGLVRQLIAEPLGAVVGAEVAGEVGRRIGGETGEAIGEFAGGLAGAGLAGSRYDKIAADPRTYRLGIGGSGPSSGFEPDPSDFAAHMQSKKDVAAGADYSATPEYQRPQQTSMRDQEAWYTRQEAEAARQPPPTTRLGDQLDEAPPHPGPRPGEYDGEAPRPPPAAAVAIDRGVDDLARMAAAPPPADMTPPAGGGGLPPGRGVTHPEFLQPEASMPNRSVSIGRQIFDRTRNVLGSMGEGGKELTGRLHAWREGAETDAAAYLDRMPTVKALGKNDVANMVDVLEGNAKPASAQVERAAAEAKAVLDDLYSRAENAGVKVADRIDAYFPHVYRDATIKARLDTARRGELIKRLMDSGQTSEEADRAVHRWAQGSERDRRQGNLEMARLANLPGYEKTKEALYNHILTATRRAHEIAQFGREDAIADRLLDRIGAEGYPLPLARDLYQTAVGAHTYAEGLRKLSSISRAYQTITRLGWAVLGNATQPVNTASVLGVVRTMAASAKAALSPTERRFADLTGATLDSVIREVREGGGWSDQVTGKAMLGFGEVEKWNRRLTAIAARDFARDMATRAAGTATGLNRIGTRTGATRALEAMGLDAKAIVGRGGKLTPAEEIAAARSHVEREQFRTDPQDIPEWASHPAGRLVFQFKAFPYAQSAFVKRELIDEAKRGNVAPLVRFAILAPLATAAATEARNVVTGRDPEEDPGMRAAQYALGPLGLVGDVSRNVLGVNSHYVPGERRASMLAGSLLGPTVGMMTEAGAAGLSLADIILRPNTGTTEAKVKPAIRFAARQVPYLGGKIANTLAPYKSQEDSAPAAPSRNRDSGRSSRDSGRSRGR